jgi:hypothetical protein
MGCLCPCSALTLHVRKIIAAVRIGTKETKPINKDRVSKWRDKTVHNLRIFSIPTETIFYQVLSRTKVPE